MVAVGKVMVVVVALAAVPSGLFGLAAMFW
jgi:hypothetical protein